jgi:predicted metal-dependent HD superfamily phosphohydrolase
MSILGSDSERYAAYADEIRQEYAHVPETVYCQRRAEFLRSVLAGGMKTFSSEIFAPYEAQVISNIQWECNKLDPG